MGELLVEPIVEVARPEPDVVFGRREAGGNAIRRPLRPVVEKDRHDPIDIERMRLVILARAELGHDKGCPGNVLDFSHRPLLRRLVG